MIFEPVLYFAHTTHRALINTSAIVFVNPDVGIKRPNDNLLIAQWSFVFKGIDPGERLNMWLYSYHQIYSSCGTHFWHVYLWTLVFGVNFGLDSVCLLYA